jgi:hypothetical protein
VSTRWAVAVPLKQAAATAPLRTVPGIEVCVTDDRLWLRGTQWTDDLDRSFRKILGAERFHQKTDGQLVPWSRILPTARLPDGAWRSLSTWLQPVLPTTVYPSTIGKQAALHLVRTYVERDANVLRVDTHAWRNYAATAPRVRLLHLAFAVSEDGQVVIRGLPLPPLQGAQFVEVNGIAAPTGWTWTPALDAASLRQSIGITDGGLAMFTLEGTCDVIEADNFVRATRSAVRLTEEALRHG